LKQKQNLQKQKKQKRTFQKLKPFRTSTEFFNYIKQGLYN